MYESLLLESGKVFMGSRVSGIGADVVDDTMNITIPVLIQEGLAVIVSVVAPDSFTPGVPFDIAITVRNDGGDDNLFIKFTNTDTQEVLIDYMNPMITTTGQLWIYYYQALFTQTTDFHGLIKAGHVE